MKLFDLNFKNIYTGESGATSAPRGITIQIRIRTTNWKTLKQPATHIVYAQL